MDRHELRDRILNIAPVTFIGAYIGALLFKDKVIDPPIEAIADYYREVRVKQIMAPLNDSRFDKWRANEEAIKKSLTPRSK